MTYHPHDDLPDAPAPRFDGFGAPITTSTHELEDHREWPQTFEQPGETWCRCTCGEDMDSIGSAGGPALPIAELFDRHLDDVTKETPR